MGEGSVGRGNSSIYQALSKETDGGRELAGWLGWGTALEIFQLEMGEKKKKAFSLIHKCNLDNIHTSSLPFLIILQLGGFSGAVVSYDSEVRVVKRAQRGIQKWGDSGTQGRRQKGGQPLQRHRHGIARLSTVG